MVICKVYPIPLTHTTVRVETDSVLVDFDFETALGTNKELEKSYIFNFGTFLSLK